MPLIEIKMGYWELEEGKDCVEKTWITTKIATAMGKLCVEWSVYGLVCTATMFYRHIMSGSGLATYQARVTTKPKLAAMLTNMTIYFEAKQDVNVSYRHLEVI